MRLSFRLNKVSSFSKEHTTVLAGMQFLPGSRTFCGGQMLPVVCSDSRCLNVKKSNFIISLPGNYKRLLRILNVYNSESIKYVHILNIHTYILFFFFLRNLY